MSLTLFSLSSAPPVQSSARTAERDNDPQTPVAGSFGEALSRASQPADEPVPKSPGKASTATTTTTTRRSGESEEEPDKPDEGDLVAGLALMMLNSRNSPLVARSAGTGTVKESAVTPQDETAAAASTIARRPAGLVKDLDKPAGMDLAASLDLTAPGSSTAPLVPGSAVNAALDVQTLQPAAADPLAQNLRNTSLPTQDAAALYGTGTVTGTKATVEPALLAELTAPFEKEVAQNLRNTSLPAQDAAALYGTGTVTGTKATVEPALLAELTAPFEKEVGRPALIARKEVNALATTPDAARMADPRAVPDATTLIPPAQNTSGLSAAGAVKDKVGHATITVTQARVNSLTDHADGQAQPQSEILISSQSTSRFTGPVLDAATDSPAATTMMGSAGTMPTRFDVATGTITSTATGTTTDVVPVLPQNIGSTDWGKALGQHVLHMSRTGQETAELQLNPPGLGPLKVSLSMNEHQIQAAFVSSHASVRAAVEAALPQLRAAMADGGISLGETSVGSQSQQAADTRQGQEGRPGQRGHPDSPARELAGATQRAVAEPRRRVNGASVDIYA